MLFGFADDFKVFFFCSKTLFVNKSLNL